ncbi:MAG: hypothetical protein RIR70_2095, partial [Pseudomonadota bacterium]
MPEKAEVALPETASLSAAAPGKFRWPTALLWLCLFFAFAFWLKNAFTPAPPHPYIKAETEAGVSVTLLNYGTPDRHRCEQQVADMSRAMQSACPVCKVVERGCKAELSEEEYDWLSDQPLTAPSARSAEGVIVFQAPASELAHATCRLSEGHNAGDTLRCFAPGADRPYPADQQKRINKATRNFDALMILTGSLAGLIVSLLLSSRLLGATAPLSRVWTVKLTLAAFDLLVMLSAYAVLGFPDFDEPLALRQFDQKNLLTHAALVVITLTMFWVVLEHYTRRRPFWDELREIFRTLWIQILLAGAAVFYLGLESGRGLTLVTWATLFIALPLGRAAAKQLLDSCGLWKQPTVIVGTGDNAKDAYLAVVNEGCLGYDVIGLIPTPATDPSARNITIRGRVIPILNGTDPCKTIASLNAPQIIIALDTTSPPEKQRMIRQITSSCRNIHFIPSIRGLPLFGTQLSHFFSHEVLFLTVRNNLSRRSYRWVKRGFDLICATIGLILLSPLFVGLAWLIRQDGGNALYGHTRIGRQGKPFQCLKFRSMRMDAD